MKIETIGDYQIWESDGHGKNVKGNKKTTGIQVREYISTGGYFIKKTFNFIINNREKRAAAIFKARLFINQQSQ